MGQAVAYYRVSAAGPIRLGLEAQRAGVAHLAEADGITILSRFEEVETEKGSNALDWRPKRATAPAASEAVS